MSKLSKAIVIRSKVDKKNCVHAFKEYSEVIINEDKNMAIFIIQLRKSAPQ